MKTAQEYWNRIFNPFLIAAAINKMSVDLGKPDRHGGVLLIAVMDPVCSSCETKSVGNPGSKLADYAFNAGEKFRRLLERRRAGNSEVASSVSASPPATYGGCIVAMNEDGCEVYLSFSGGPAKVDEAICFVLAEKLCLTIPDYQNELIEQARELLKA